MQAKEKSNSVVTSSWDLAKGVLTLSVVGVTDKIEFDVRAWAGPDGYDKLTDDGKRGLMHGMNQRVSNRSAIGRDKLSGASATPMEKWEAMNQLVEHYKNGGTWDIGELPPVNRPALYQAVAFVRGADAAKVEAIYRDKTDEVVRTLLTIPAIAGKYTEIVKGRVQAANPKADELLKALDALTPPSEQPKEQPKQPEKSKK